MSVYVYVFSLCLTLISFNVHSNEETLSFKQRLETAISKEPPEWMMQQINQDLSPYTKSGITRASLDKLMEVAKGELTEMTVRFQITDGQVTYTCNDAYFIKFPDHASFFHSRINVVVPAIKKLANSINLPNVDFIITVNDFAYTRNDLSLAPIFVFSKNKYIENHILFPDSDALCNYYNVESSIIESSKNTPWENKINKVFWRGGTTDGCYDNIRDKCYDADHWRFRPRAILVLLSLKYPELIDAKFTYLLKDANANHEILSMPEIISNYIAQSDSLHCKYLIVIDGATCSWQRLYWTLLSNCVVFRQITDNIEWFYRALNPYYHYIPVAKDMSDLIEKTNYAQINDREMQQIATNGTQFAKENLSQDMIYLYMYLLITNYAKLLDF